MTIQFYLNNEEETHIYSMCDMISNPFKIGDTIKLSVGDITPVKLQNYTPEFTKKLTEENKQKRSMLHKKEIKIVRECKYIDIENDIFTIEYHCVFVSKK